MPSSNAFDTQYKKLNKAQKKAVDATEGPVMVVAGPGSGKTEILSLRVANILQKTQMRPGNILCLTFTDAAAINMRKRLIPLLGTDAYRVAVHTFHNFCVDIISRYPEFFYGGASFSAADALVQVQALEEIFNNLPYDSALKSIHPEQGFVYLSDAQKSIAHLKKAGVSPEELSKIIDHNELSLVWLNPLINEVFGLRVGKETLIAAEQLVATLRKRKEATFPVGYWKSLKESVADSLEIELRNSSSSEKPTASMSAWKAKYLEKNTEGKQVLSETVRIEKLRTLAGVYKNYKENLFSKGYYDFDDMIIDAIAVVENNESLRAMLQEQFQYILVDEFQDTNDAQMRLLRSIADAPVNEGRPNLMVVGDDDQAIYKFQGAEISNILNFRKSYIDPVIVTMVENYRSTQDILNIAQHVIRKGGIRLETLIPEMEKTLVASNKNLEKGSIVRKILPSREEEYDYVSREIKKLIAGGVSPSEIAIISRKHEILEHIVPHLHKQGVPIRYERQQNVLNESHIHQIIQISRFVASVARKDLSEADNLLPEILSYPFWNIPRIDIWNISLEAKNMETDRQSAWMEAMKKSSSLRVKEVADFLLDLGVSSLSLPLEHVVDRIVGAHVRIYDEAEEDQESGSAFFEPYQLEKNKGVISSPFKEFYFSRQRFEKNKGQYLTFLSSLRVFMQALREYKQGEILKVEDLVAYVDIHQKNGLLVTDNSPYISALSAVSLLSAHKAKGLEFETVFVLSCEDSVWMSRGYGSKLPFPMNLPIAPAGDDFDDKLRLFFVAITRAKRHLYLTASKSGDKGDEALPLQFISTAPQDFFNEPDDSVIEKDTPEITEILADSWHEYHKPPTTIKESVLLSHMVENYQMSVTHLNNFLDVTKGGPQAFLELNLLRFPQAKTVSAGYGTAIHATIERAYTHIRREGHIPSKEAFLDIFITLLKKERLSNRDLEEHTKRGIKNLTLFYDAKKDTFNITDKIEVNFKNQGVIVEGAHLAGKIDKMVSVSGNKYIVHDFKTGSVARSWKGTTDYEKIKLNNYARQLAFYKLLVENSREFSDHYTVDMGVVEFVETDDHGTLVDLPLVLEPEFVKRTEKLISAVYKKIVSLDFPDTTKYPQNFKGVLEFEEDLLSIYPIASEPSL